MLYNNIKMGLTKAYIFTKDQNVLADIFKALAHPGRIAILQHISKQKGCICNDIVEEIGLAQPTISQHLKELKQVGLIKGEISGKKICYCINTERWTEIQSLINNFLLKTESNSC